MWLDRERYDLETLHEASLQMVDGVMSNSRDILHVLGGIATRSSIIDEVHRAIRTLAGAPFEILRNNPSRLSQVGVFFPSNNILYSYALFAMVPSLYSDEVVLRPSSRVAPETAGIHELLGRFARGEVKLANRSQRAFLEDCRSSDAVIFTGQADNAAQVRAALVDGPRVLCFGSGPTPIVIGPAADVRQATRELVSARLFNSGQDCLGPDITFVHADVLPQVLEELTRLLVEVREHDAQRTWPHLIPSGYEDAVADAEAFLLDHARSVVHGAGVDLRAGTVDPTVILLPWDECYEPAEFFSPLFCLMEYAHASQIRGWLARPRQLLHGMYLSEFGEPALSQDCYGTTRIVHGATVFDVEDGNLPFGGFGPNAGAVQVDGEVIARPLLLSAEMGGSWETSR